MLVPIVSVLMLSGRQPTLAFRSIPSPSPIVRSSTYPVRAALASSRSDAMPPSRQEESPPLSIAILGGGIAGLSCATHLLRQSSDSDANVRITLFDTGRLRPGGRCSSRLPNDSPAAVKNRSSGVSNVRRACDDTAAEGSGTGSDGSGHEMPNDNIGSILKRQQMQSTSTAASRDRILTAMGPVDHAAQILSIPAEIPSLVDANDAECFQHQLNTWLQDQVIESFPEGSVCELLSLDPSNGNSSTLSKPRLQPIQGQMCYGKGGMSSIPLAMRDHCLAYNDLQHSRVSFQIMQDVWVSPSNGVKYIGNNHKNSKDGDSVVNEPQWELRAGPKSLGKYHRLIIAHNGKCADRIMSKTPAKEFHSLLRTKFAPYVPKWGGNEMTLNSIYSLVFAIKCPKDSDNDRNGAVHTSYNSPIVNALKNLSQSAAESSPQQSTNDIYTVIIKNEPNLRLLSSNTLKHRHHKNPNAQSSIEVYTLLSSPQFGRQYKGPQENLPLDLMEKVTTEMLHSLEKAFNIDRGTVLQNVVDLKLQLWGAAVPMNTWKSGKDSDGFVYDAQYGVGACGDWILDASIAGAWESGRRLAKWILEEHHHQQQQQQRTGGDMEEGDGLQRWSVGLPNLSSENGRQLGGKFVPSRAALESGIGTIPSTAFVSPLYNNDDGKKSFGSRGPSRTAGRGSGSSRRQYTSGNNRGSKNAATNGGGRGRNTRNVCANSQPLTR
ncbi:hypothetical protein HJC23_013365 [Cyclotella cryptica]|uniref:Amine oxidase domain-containing protein n=1 Tax=Cyclotella cryptica TaxID=29204 RepID=A0ABD3P766_9STRA